MRGNTASIKGNLTRDAEIRRTQSGNNSISFGLAWNQSKRNQQGGYEDVPHYFEVEAWVTDAQLGYLQPLLAKGARCAVVDGHLEYQSWTDNQGNKRSKVVVRCDNPINGLLVEPPRASSGGGYQQPAPNYQQPAQGSPYNGPYAPQGHAYGQGTPQPQQPAPAPSPYDEDIPF